MGKMLQIRNVSPELHAELVRRAKSASKTLTDYVEDVLEREVARPPREEVFTRLSRRTPVELAGRAADFVAKARREAC